MKICIIGERSKIGQSIIKNLPNDYQLVSPNENPDYYFLATTSEKAQEFFIKNSDKYRIVDFSGALKPEIGQNPDLTYAFSPVFDPEKKHIVFPGCSALAILTALYPLKSLLTEPIFADVKFSKSSMQYKSKTQTSILINQIEVVRPFTHIHEQEINKVLNCELVKIIPSVVNIESGLFINLYFNSTEKIETILKEFYTNHPEIVFDQKLVNILGTDKISLQVFQKNTQVCISVITDNLVNGKIFKFLTKSNLKK